MIICINNLLISIVAIDTYFGKRILIMKVKGYFYNQGIIKIISRSFDFNTQKFNHLRAEKYQINKHK